MTTSDNQIFAVWFHFNGHIAQTKSIIGVSDLAKFLDCDIVDIVCSMDQPPSWCEVVISGEHDICFRGTLYFSEESAEWDIDTDILGVAKVFSNTNIRKK